MIELEILEDYFNFKDEKLEQLLNNVSLIDKPSHEKIIKILNCLKRFSSSNYIKYLSFNGN